MLASSAVQRRIFAPIEVLNFDTFEASTPSSSIENETEESNSDLRDIDPVKDISVSSGQEKFNRLAQDHSDLQLDESNEIFETPEKKDTTDLTDVSFTLRKDVSNNVHVVRDVWKAFENNQERPATANLKKRTNFQDKFKKKTLKTHRQTTLEALSTKSTLKNKKPTVAHKIKVQAKVDLYKEPGIEVLQTDSAEPSQLVDGKKDVVNLDEDAVLVESSPAPRRFLRKQNVKESTSDLVGEVESKRLKESSNNVQASRATEEKSLIKDKKHATDGSQNTAAENNPSIPFQDSILKGFDAIADCLIQRMKLIDSQITKKETQMKAELDLKVKELHQFQESQKKEISEFVNKLRQRVESSENELENLLNES